MKVTIDTERKVIEIDEAVNLLDLINGLKAFLGKDWKEYSIEQKAGWAYPHWPTYPVIYPTIYTDYDGDFISTPVTCINDGIIG